MLRHVAKRSAAVGRPLLRTTLSANVSTRTTKELRSPLYKSTAVFAVANTVGFGISVATGSHLHLDLVGTGGFAVAAVASVSGQAAAGSHALWSAGAISFWSIRLASFLFYRALQTGHDKRLDETLETTTGAAGFWFVSFLWGVVCTLPHTLAAGAGGAGLKSLRSSFPQRATSLLGVAAVVTGFVVEALADWQKWKFKATNPGKFCDEGLWSSSQHPNYAGNLLFWSGMVLMNSRALLLVGKNLERMTPMVFQRYFPLLFAALSPIFMTLLFYGQASNTFTNTVELANSKYGSDPRYQEYVEKTPLIIPWPWS